MKYICPRCRTEVKTAKIEQYDMCCPRCGTILIDKEVWERPLKLNPPLLSVDVSIDNKQVEQAKENFEEQIEKAIRIYINRNLL